MSGAAGPITGGTPDRTARALDAPQLRETADIWWDSGADPVIRWDAQGRRFWLVDGAEPPAGRLELLSSDAPVADPRAVAEALREGLAACDFPPTADGVSPERATATLRAAGISL